MNLYKVWIKNQDWCTFVFAETRNKAKYKLVGNFGEDEYCDIRSSLLKRNVGGSAALVECEGDADYKRVQELGFGFREEVEE